MKAQIFEPFTGWHHTRYVSFIVPALMRLLDAGQLERVILTTTASHRDSPYFADLLSGYGTKLELDILPLENLHSGRQVATMLLGSVERNRPDYLVSTSANNGAAWLALRSIYETTFRSRRMSSVGVLHNGHYRPVRGVHDRLEDATHRFARRYAPWSELHVVNPLLYRFLRERRGWPEARLKLLPNPVERLTPVSKAAARERLAIPTEGTYIGQVGKSDGRKAIPELLAAFRAAGSRPDSRMLLAGSLHPPYKELVEREYGDLVRAQRLIVLDRYLHPDELYLANCALDVVCVANYTDQLSDSMLGALAARRPVLADRRGYCGMILETFGAGYATEIRSPSALSATLAEAFATGPAFRLPPKLERLLEYHDPRNFADTLLQPLYSRLGLPSANHKTWDWVLREAGAPEALLAPR